MKNIERLLEESNGRKLRSWVDCKGKIRYGIKKVPRKLKKKQKKELEKQTVEFYKQQENHLRPLYGDDWFSHVIFGG